MRSEPSPAGREPFEKSACKMSKAHTIFESRLEPESHLSTYAIYLKSCLHSPPCWGHTLKSVFTRCGLNVATICQNKKQPIPRKKPYITTKVKLRQGGDFYVSFIYIVAVRSSQTSLHIMDGRIGNFHRNFRSNGVVIGSFCSKGVCRPKLSPTENTLLSTAKVKLPFRLSGSGETASTLTKLVEGNI